MKFHIDFFTSNQRFETDAVNKEIMETLFT